MARVQTPPPSIEIATVLSGDGRQFVAQWMWMQKKDNLKWLEEQFDRYAEALEIRSSNERESVELKQAAEIDRETAARGISEAEERARQIEAGAVQRIGVRVQQLDERQERLDTGEDYLRRRRGEVEQSARDALNAADAAARKLGEAETLMAEAQGVKDKYDALTARIDAAREDSLVE